jgi:mannose/fructose/N-acetylgalactosamine-specific phosphotransferase system component IIC
MRRCAGFNVSGISAVLTPLVALRRNGFAELPTAVTVALPVVPLALISIAVVGDTVAIVSGTVPPVAVSTLHVTVGLLPVGYATVLPCVNRARAGWIVAERVAVAVGVPAVKVSAVDGFIVMLLT